MSRGLSSRVRVAPRALWGDAEGHVAVALLAEDELAPVARAACTPAPTWAGSA